MTKLRNLSDGAIWALCIGAVVLGCVIGVVTNVARGADEPQPAVQEFVCADGQWSDATIAGEGHHGSLSGSVHADLDNGDSVEFTGSGGRKITTHDDGRVEGEGGELTVTCTSPTH